MKPALAALLKTADSAWQSKLPPEILKTGLEVVDSITGGLPRGAITEIHGPHSSGRTTLLSSILSHATANDEVCALIDTADTFDPVSADSAGVLLDRVLWTRCKGDAEIAMRVLDLILQSGGFGIVIFDLADTPVQTARRISLASWYRYRRTVEQTRTVLIVLGLEPYARQCASLSIEASQERLVWSGNLLKNVHIRLERRKPVGGLKVSLCLSA